MFGVLGCRVLGWGGGVGFERGFGVRVSGFGVSLGL